MSTPSLVIFLATPPQDVYFLDAGTGDSSGVKIEVAVCESPHEVVETTSSRTLVAGDLVLIGVYNKDWMRGYQHYASTGAHVVLVAAVNDHVNDIPVITEDLLDKTLREFGLTLNPVTSSLDENPWATPEPADPWGALPDVFGEPETIPPLAPTPASDPPLEVLHDLFATSDPASFDEPPQHVLESEAPQIFHPEPLPPIPVLVHQPEPAETHTPTPMASPTSEPHQSPPQQQHVEPLATLHHDRNAHTAPPLPTTKTPTCHILSVGSRKGGVGKTALAMLIASRLSVVTQQGLPPDAAPRTCLLDLDLGKADVQWNLRDNSTRSVSDIADAWQHGRHISTELVAQCMSEVTDDTTGTRFWVLHGPRLSSAASTETLPIELFEVILDRLKQIFTWIVIDTPEARMNDPWIHFAVRHADRFIVPISPDAGVLDPVREFLDEACLPIVNGGLGCARERIAVVLTMSHLGSDLNFETLCNVLEPKYSVYADIPRSKAWESAKGSGHTPPFDAPELVAPLNQLLLAITGNRGFEPAPEPPKTSLLKRLTRR